MDRNLSRPVFFLVQEIVMVGMMEPLGTPR